MLAVEPCTTGPLLWGWSVRAIHLELRMGFHVGPGGPLLLMRTRLGQLVAFEGATAVAVWQYGTPETVALRWCARRAGWLDPTLGGTP